MMSEKPLEVIAGAPDRPLRIGGIEIDCYVLEDETRVFSTRGLTRAIGLNPGAGFRIPQFIGSRDLKPFVPNELTSALKSPKLCKNPVGGGTMQTFEAEILPGVVNAVLDARDAGKLSGSQLDIAKICDVLRRGLMNVAIIALVDEATGYERIREEKALATILEKFIAKELQPWTKTFPYEFYEQIFRLKGWPGPDGVKRPSVIGHYTNDIVYARLAPGVLDDLKKRNPTIPSTGRRKRTHHQWFTPDFGHPRLKEHLAAVIALMKISPNWNRFMANLPRAFPRRNETIPLELDD